MLSTSLIIPNRNNARFLGRCLESVLAQSRPYAEVVVVDDGSEDDSVRVIEGYARQSSSIRLIRLVEPGGVSAARNCGIRAATSPYVALLDSDDFLWDRDKNARELALIEAGLPQDTIMAFSDIVLVSVTGEEIGRVAARRRVREGSLYLPLLYLECFVPRDFTFARRLHEAAGGFDERFSLYEDWDFKLRLARLADFRYTHGPGVAYRSNPVGLSRAPLHRHFQALRSIARKNTSHLPWFQRWSVRILAQWGIFRFLKGPFLAWLKQNITRLVRT